MQHSFLDLAPVKCLSARLEVRLPPVLPPRVADFHAPPRCCDSPPQEEALSLVFGVFLAGRLTLAFLSLSLCGVWACFSFSAFTESERGSLQLPPKCTFGQSGGKMGVGRRPHGPLGHISAEGRWRELGHRL